MAATKILTLMLIAAIFTFRNSFSNFFTPVQSGSQHISRLDGNNSVTRWKFIVLMPIQFNCSFIRVPCDLRIRKSITKGDTYGHTLLAARKFTPTLDITIFMDIERNPGLVVDIEGKEKSQSKTVSSITYSRKELLNFRRTRIKPTCAVINTLKNLELFRYRGTRAGRKASGNPDRAIELVRDEQKRKRIPVIIGRRYRIPLVNKVASVARNIIVIPKVIDQYTTNCSSQFAVPELMFTNICSLTKTKNKVRAAVALEADMINNDIDVCVVSETHLKPDQPDAVINIPNYTIHRRDRNWSGRDIRQKGGKAVYIRKNLSVIDVMRSDLYELIGLTVELATKHRMLICGLYHPPKFKYRECELMNCLQKLLDNALDKDPNILIVCGDDLNQLDLTLLQRLTGLSVLVDFPTKDDAFLDNCLTNKPELSN